MEVINSFFSNIKDKLTNPFFGTLLIVLIIDHWKFWYAIFNFDEGVTLNNKFTFLEKYISENLTLGSFLWDIGQAVLYMLLGYLIVIGTRSLVLWIEFDLMPTITGKIVNSKVVRKSEYDEVVEERESYFDQYEKQRENVRKFSKTIDEQSAQIKRKDKDLLEQSDKISKTVNDLTITKRNLEKVTQDFNTKKDSEEKLKISLENLQKHFEHKKERLRLYQHLFLSKENEDFYSAKENFPPEVLSKANELIKDDKWSLFAAVAKFYQNGGMIGGEAVNEMYEMGLVFNEDNREELTPLGQIIWKYRHVLGPKENYEVY